MKFTAGLTPARSGELAPARDLGIGVLVLVAGPLSPLGQTDGADGGDVTNGLFNLDQGRVPDDHVIHEVVVHMLKVVVSQYFVDGELDGESGDVRFVLVAAVDFVHPD